jgi:transposase-like protein
MFIYQTKKRDLYYDRVIELYLKTGYGKKRLSRLFPDVGQKTISRWIANFVADNPQVASMKRAKATRKAPVPTPPAQEIQSEDLPTDVQELQAELKKLRAQLTKAEIKAEAYDELINVAEAKFNIPIRKKAGAKQ